MTVKTGTGPLLKRVSIEEPPVEQIHETLLAAILSLELAPGTRVSEAAIARSVGASRTPVRAALARLSEDGLIETRPSRGNYVTRLNADALRDAHFIRDALETSAAAWLAEHGLPAASRQQLQTNLSASADAVARLDTVRFGQLDIKFHHLLAEATGNRRFVHVLEREKAGLSRLRALCPVDTPYMQDIVDEHTGIIDAVLAGDAPLARRRVSGHIGRALVVLEGLQERHADFFDESHSTESVAMARDERTT